MFPKKMQSLPKKVAAMINLLSDTVTKPTKAMLQAMMQAEVGDDVFREDPTVNALEEFGAGLFGQEAGLFCPSGTMTNQIAIKMHTRPLDEVLCHQVSHVYQSEVAGYAFHSGVGVSLLAGNRGILEAATVEAAIRPRADWMPVSRLIVLENTVNFGGGACYPMENISAIAEVARRRGLALHLDGARIFNAIVAKGYSPQEIGAHFDSVSVCLSKGLGAPVGSLLLGKADFIAEARRVRKAFGGGMRQAGFLAAAGLFALHHQVERLENDHRHAAMLAQCLESLPYVASVMPTETNIVIFDLVDGYSSADFVLRSGQLGLKCAAFGPKTIRLVTHLDVSQEEIQQAIGILSSIRLD